MLQALTSRRSARRVGAIIGAAAGLCLAAGTADAYIDPGTGSYGIQVIAAAIGGAALAIRQVWARMRPRLPSRRGAEPPQDGCARGDVRAKSPRES